jgi:hypothetical protein
MVMVVQQVSADGTDTLWPALPDGVKKDNEGKVGDNEVNLCC